MSPSLSYAACSSVAGAVGSPSILDTEKQAIIEKYVADIISCYNALVNLPHLQPCLTVNKAFSELMVICMQIPEEPIVHAVSTFHAGLRIMSNHGTRSLQTHGWPR